MKDKTILKTGIIGTVIAVICCFTPFLVVVLGGVGLSAWLGWLDYVLLPALAICVLIMAYGFYRVWRRTGGTQEKTI
ncbi:MAG: mercury resistance system transport protein MerF [Proteobacteria bacterium]|nr:mercury resistance system transport protein MerF [Pseudomonadota bacterium]